MKTELEKLEERIQEIRKEKKKGIKFPIFLKTYSDTYCRLLSAHKSLKVDTSKNRIEISSYGSPTITTSEFDSYISERGVEITEKEFNDSYNKVQNKIMKLLK